MYLSSGVVYTSTEPVHCDEEHLKGMGLAKEAKILCLIWNHIPYNFSTLCKNVCPNLIKCLPFATSLVSYENDCVCLLGIFCMSSDPTYENDCICFLSLL